MVGGLRKIPCLVAKEDLGIIHFIPIAHIRRSLGISQEEAAKRLGVSRQTISAYERGAKVKPYLKAGYLLLLVSTNPILAKLLLQVDSIEGLCSLIYEEGKP